MKSYIEFFDGVLFDLDGTLVSLHINWELVRSDMRNEFESLCGKPFPKAGINILLNTAIGYGQTDARYIAAKILKKYELAADFTQIDETIALFRSFATQKNLAIVSNNLHVTIENVLRKLEIFAPNLCIIGFDDVRNSKPDPEGILTALKTLDVSEQRAVMIGDTETDKKAAESAGICFCHVEKLCEEKLL